MIKVTHLDINFNKEVSMKMKETTTYDKAYIIRPDGVIKDETHYFDFSDPDIADPAELWLE